jgi:hypothetical protein
MTALNVVRSASVVHIATDGLIGLTTPDGLVLERWLAPKVFLAPHMPLAVATRGQWEAAFGLGISMVRLFSEFDALIDRLERIFPQLHLAQRQSTGAPDLHSMRTTEVVIAGWSTARSQAEAYYIWGGEKSDLADCSCPPFKLMRLEGLACAPVPSQHVDVDPNHIERDMLAVMEAQRSEFPLAIGGFCQLTSLTQHAVTQRILRRWPDLPSERSQAGGSRTPPARAITYLRHHPETADKFDQEYGTGMAAKILGGVMVASSEGWSQRAKSAIAARSRVRAR